MAERLRAIQAHCYDGVDRIPGDEYDVADAFVDLIVALKIAERISPPVGDKAPPGPESSPDPASPIKPARRKP